MRSKQRGTADLELVGGIALAGIFTLVMIAGWIIHSHNEARVFNKLTGADATWGDAMWVQLRVMEPFKRKHD